MPDDYGSIRNIPQSRPLGRLAAILQYAKEVAAALAARQDQPMWSAVGRLAELGLARAPETVENYSYGFPPKTEAGPFGAVNPANFELAGITPVGTAAKGLALAGKGALAAGKGLAAIPFMGTTKGLTEALTKVEPTVDAFAAMKDLAHSYMGTPPLTAAHPAIAHLPAQDQQAVIDWQKLFQQKYDIWKGPEEHAAYFAKNKQSPSGFSFEEYPPGWADKVQEKLDELIAQPAAGQGPATKQGQASHPLAHWSKDSLGTYETVGPTTDSGTLQGGWNTTGLGFKDWPPGGTTYAEHSLGTKLLHGDEPGVYELHFPDGGVEGPFNSAIDAKQYHFDAENAGLIAPTAKGPAANPKMGQFTPEELAAQQGPVGTTGGPGPAAGTWIQDAYYAHMQNHPSGGWVWEDPHQPGNFSSFGPGGNILGKTTSAESAKELVEKSVASPPPAPAATAPSQLTALASPGDQWKSVGGPGEEVWGHPSGYTIEKASTGNYHVKPPGGDMVDFFSKLEEAKSSAELHHISKPITTVEGLAASPPTPPEALPVDPWYHLHKRNPENINWTYDPNPPGPNASGLVATHVSGTKIVSEGLKQNYLTKGGNKVGPFDTPTMALEAYNKHYAAAHPQAAPVGAAGGSEQLAAVQELRDKYGVTQEEVKMWLEYEPQMTPKKILERYTEAEQAFAKGGMAAEQYRDPDIRATALGALPYELARGSYRQNPVPTAPITAPAGAAMRTSNSTGWAHPWLFTSDVPSGAQYYQSYPHQMENLRALTEEGRIFRPDRIKANPDAPITHEFEQAYDFLKAQEAAGRPFPAEYKPRPGETKIFESTGKEVVDRWRTSGHNAGYSHIERPDVAITLQQMGMRGFTTHERGGTNYAFFHDVPLRWYKAPFDPRKRSIPGYFLGPAAAGAGSALLARELLLQHAGQGEEQ